MTSTCLLLAGAVAVTAVACGSPVGADGVDAGAAPDAGGAPDVVTLPDGQYPIQVILNIHNHSPAARTAIGQANRDLAELHCRVRQFTRVADGWLRLPDVVPGIRFSFMLDGQYTAWNTYHRDHQVAGGDFCDQEVGFVSPYIIDEVGGAASAQAYIDLAAMIADGHEIGIHHHCHELATGDNPDALFWTNLANSACEGATVTAKGDEVLEQVRVVHAAALAGTGYVETAIHDSMGTIDWRLDHGLTVIDGGFEALQQRNVAHVLWNPYRPCCVRTGDGEVRCDAASDPHTPPQILEAGGEGCDPAAAAFLAVPELAQLGASNPHASAPTSPAHLLYERRSEGIQYGSNNELPQAKKTFWMLYHERRVWELLGLPPRVWVIGWATHDDRTTERQMRYDAGYRRGAGYPAYDPDVEDPTEGILPQVYGWIGDQFVGDDAAIEAVAEFATFRQVADRFEAWEAGPGAGQPAIALDGYAGAAGDYPYQVRFNRLLGPGWVALVSADSAPGALVFERRDAGPGGYDLTPCDETGPYTYGGTANGAAGDPVRRSECDRRGAVVGRYVLVWADEDGGTIDVRAACGGFAGADVAVLDHDEDDPAAATREDPAAVTTTKLPRLVVCDA